MNDVSALPAEQDHDEQEVVRLQQIIQEKRAVLDAAQAGTPAYLSALNAVMVATVELVNFEVGIPVRRREVYSARTAEVVKRTSLGTGAGVAVVGVLALTPLLSIWWLTLLIPLMISAVAIAVTAGTAAPSDQPTRRNDRTAREQAEDLEEKLDSLESELSETSRTMRRLGDRMSWVERHIRASGAAMEVDFDELAEDCASFVTKIEQGEEAEALLLNDTERRQLEHVRTLFTQQAKRITELTTTALQASATLTATSFGDQAHMAAAEAFRTAFTARQSEAKQHQQARDRAENARARLAQDDQLRATHTATILAGRSAAQTMRLRLRTAIAEAIGGGALDAGVVCQLARDDAATGWRGRVARRGHRSGRVPDHLQRDRPGLRTRWPTRREQLRPMELAPEAGTAVEPLRADPQLRRGVLCVWCGRLVRAVLVGVVGFR